jgi:hypothetical protein
MPGTISQSPGICKIVVVNNTQPQWNVAILAMGCKFFFTDGTDFQDGPVAGNWGANADYSLSTNDPTKCVKGIFLTIAAQAAGQPPQSYPASKEYNGCLTFWQVSFGAVSAVTAMVEADDEQPLKNSLGLQFE